MMRTLRGRLAVIGGCTATGLLLATGGLVADRAFILLLGVLVLGVPILIAAPITPRGFGNLLAVARLAWAMLRRIENGAPIAPETVLTARRLDSGALLLRLRYPVTIASSDKRMAWLRSALSIRPDEPFDVEVESTRVVAITIGSLGA